MKYINGVEVCLFENFNGGGRGMKPSFGRGGGDIDIGFFSKGSFINDVTIKMDFGRPPPLYIYMSFFWCPPPTPTLLPSLSVTIFLRYKLH